jgi:hypothetical protein
VPPANQLSDWFLANYFTRFRVIELKSETPPATRRNRWATRKFKTKGRATRPERIVFERDRMVSFIYRFGRRSTAQTLGGTIQRVRSNIQ